MSQSLPVSKALNDDAAWQLANATKTTPQMSTRRGCGIGHGRP